MPSVKSLENPPVPTEKWDRNTERRKMRAGWERGLQRRSSLYVQRSYRDAVRLAAAFLGASSGALTEHALRRLFETDPSLANIRDQILSLLSD